MKRLTIRTTTAKVTPLGRFITKCAASGKYEVKYTVGDKKKKG